MLGDREETTGKQELNCHQLTVKKLNTNENNSIHWETDSFNINPAWTDG